MQMYLAIIPIEYWRRYMDGYNFCAQSMVFWKSCEMGWTEREAGPAVQVTTLLI